jgi:ATP-dependent DNA helicase RecQ
MIDYAYADQCLRRYILEYFGERIIGSHCDNCSNCLDEDEGYMSRNVTGIERIVKGKPSEKTPEILDLPCHEDLFASLKEMRLKLARASNLPPFVIFHDRTLRAISRHLPQTTSELLAIKGCGEYKVSAYGGQTIEVVRTYLKGHPEARPLSGSAGSVAVRPVLKKTSGGSTVEITWGLWEQGGTPEDIAVKRGLASSTITEHLVQLIDEGRPIDLNRIFSKERIALIEEAVSRAGSERLAPIKALLPKDVSYDEIRLVARRYAQKAKGDNALPSLPNNP